MAGCAMPKADELSFGESEGCTRRYRDRDRVRRARAKRLSVPIDERHRAERLSGFVICSVNAQSYSLASI